MGMRERFMRLKPHHRFFLVLGVFLAALLGLGALFGDLGAGGGNYYDEARVCKDQVAENLRSPSTAEFGDTTIYTTGDAVAIGGWVDSENGFGATVRSEYRCTVETDGSVTLAYLADR